MQGLRNPEKRGVHSRTPQGRGMSVPQPFGYAQGREPVERQMVFDGQSGGIFLDWSSNCVKFSKPGIGCTWPVS